MLCPEEKDPGTRGRAAGSPGNPRTQAGEGKPLNSEGPWPEMSRAAAGASPGARWRLWPGLQGEAYPQIPRQA